MPSVEAATELPAFNSHLGTETIHLLHRKVRAGDPHGAVSNWEGARTHRGKFVIVEERRLFCDWGWGRRRDLLDKFSSSGRQAARYLTKPSDPEATIHGERNLFYGIKSTVIQQRSERQIRYRRAARVKHWWDRKGVAVTVSRSKQNVIQPFQQLVGARMRDHELAAVGDVDRMIRIIQDRLR